jgi:ketosteroid isomerase-like protein
VTVEDLTLLRYYAAVDANDYTAALALVSPDIEFSIVLPDRTIRGSDRDGISDYLNGRGEANRRHTPLRTGRDGDLEFVYGAVIENDTVTTGHFLAAARIDTDGRLAGYQVVFEPQPVLLPKETDGE